MSDSPEARKVAEEVHLNYQAGGWDLMVERDPDSDFDEVAGACVEENTATIDKALSQSRKQGYQDALREAKAKIQRLVKLRGLDNTLYELGAFIDSLIEGSGK